LYLDRPEGIQQEINPFPVRKILPIKVASICKKLLTTISGGDIIGYDISGDDIEERNGTSMEQSALTESTYYILLSLVTPRHGYGIMQQAEALSGGRVRLAAGTLYGALNALCDKGWIKPVPSAEDSRKKEYSITEKGLRILKAELRRLRQLVENGDAVLKEEEK